MIIQELITPQQPPQDSSNTTLQWVLVAHDPCKLLAPILHLYSLVFKVSVAVTAFDNEQQ